jgi:hypothetical protein
MRQRHALGSCEPSRLFLIATPQHRVFALESSAAAATRLHASKHTVGNQEEFPRSVDHQIFMSLSFGIIFLTDTN